MMFGIHDFPLFVFSCLLLNLTPGQDTMYILGRSIAQGKRAGLFSVLGIMTGVLVHTLLAALGLSVVLATSSLAFSIVKYIGAGYLIWIGIGLIRSTRGAGDPQRPAGARLRPAKVFRQGMLTNLSNPKVALFFLSFLPQFVDPQAAHGFVSFVLLGLVFFTTGSIWCLVLVLASSWLTDRFRGSSIVEGYLNKITGGLFVALGVKLAFTHAN